MTLDRGKGRKGERGCILPNYNRQALQPSMFYPGKDKLVDEIELRLGFNFDPLPNRCQREKTKIKWTKEP